MRREVALLLALLTCSAAPPEPANYRTEAYRAPVPETLAGAEVLNTETAAELWRKQAAVFIDVLPRPPHPANLPAGTIWRDKPRLDIPGSIWLPDTGYGALAPVMEVYIRRGLAEASHGDRGQLLVFYCLADCWMSWNAAKRALALGYTNVAWYREGTDGWAKAGLPLEVRDPVPRPGE
ncbi:MAG: PQQ-dependent catabolism-associated CXXCW motif protein [Acetobacteraceae bacterium]|nr:PQQ-dependent catabolism-associated CXXCW motif protein [Acetobacteraceae bacterium]